MADYSDFLVVVATVNATVLVAIAIERSRSLGAATAPTEAPEPSTVIDQRSTADVEKADSLERKRLLPIVVGASAVAIVYSMFLLSGIGRNVTADIISRGLLWLASTGGVVGFCMYHFFEDVGAVDQWINSSLSSIYNWVRHPIRSIKGRIKRTRMVNSEHPNSIGDVTQEGRTKKIDHAESDASSTVAGASST